MYPERNGAIFFVEGRAFFVGPISAATAFPGETRGEFLSGFRKTDKLIPVVTLTIYFGPDSWNGPKDLHSMMAADEETLRFVPNYRLNLLAPSELSEKDFVKFRTELSLVLKYVKYSKDKRRFAEQIRKDPAFQDVSSKTVDMVNAVAGANIRYKKGEERVNMCEAMEGLLNDARTEGRAEGRAEGREEGIIGEKKATARKLRQKGWTVEEIAEFQDVSPVDVKIWLDSEGE
ncbi:MAG: Rpn family recombination-promoting nuclease/putative transposase [Thermoguttaceae bacterium]|nr:Rpn family recombination-promoting nuclease/putative transposase [Thermoguttaceae bacterium]